MPFLVTKDVVFPMQMPQVLTAQFDSTGDCDRGDRLSSMEIFISLKQSIINNDIELLSHINTPEQVLLIDYSSIIAQVKLIYCSAIIAQVKLKARKERLTNSIYFQSQCIFSDCESFVFITGWCMFCIQIFLFVYTKSLYILSFLFVCLLRQWNFFQEISPS